MRVIHTHTHSPVLSLCDIKYLPDKDTFYTIDNPASDSSAYFVISQRGAISISRFRRVFCSLVTMRSEKKKLSVYKFTEESDFSL
jgi:hypothetical protein